MKRVDLATDPFPATFESRVERHGGRSPPRLRWISLLAFMLVALPARAQVNPTGSPNIVLIVIDDIGAKDLSCYGSSDYSTPNIDSLAEGGMRFLTCLATPLCHPSRVEILTGQYGFRNGWLNNADRPGAPSREQDRYWVGRQLTLADVLKERGYRTALAGKWQLPGRYPEWVFDAGFDEYCVWGQPHNLPPGVEHTGKFHKGDGTPSRYWHPSVMRNGKYVETQETDYGPDLYSDFLVDFIRRNKSGPFLAYYSMCLTHRPWRPTPDPGRPGQVTERGLLSNLAYADHLVGKIVGVLEKEELRDNTLVVVTADNGTVGSGKSLPTELGARVPLIVNFPGRVEGGVVSRALMDFSDILPTLAGWAGATLPEDTVIDGKDWSGYWRGEGEPPRTWAFSYLHDRRILREDQWLWESGRLYYCGTDRTGAKYEDRTDSDDPAAEEARARIAAILEHLPKPDLEPCPDLTKLWETDGREARRPIPGLEKDDGP